MAFAGTAEQRDGWGHQAEHLALTHTALGMAAMALARQARRRPAPRAVEGNQNLGTEPEPDLKTHIVAITNETESTQEARCEIEQRIAQEALAGQMKTLTAQSAEARKRIAELEGELASAREELVLRDNENRSLQSSLDLALSENARLTRHLAESEAALEKDRSQREQLKAAVAAADAGRDKDRSQLAQMKTAVAAAEAERDKGRSQLAQMKAAVAAAEAQGDKLAAAVDEMNKKRDTETTALNTYLDVMSSRAAAAERLLEETRKSACREK
jgi:crescentin